MTEHEIPQPIKDYFAFAESGNLDAYLSLFHPDAIVEDESQTHRGLDAIRIWRSGGIPVTYQITSLDPREEGWKAIATITGDFPGSPFAGLGFRFTLNQQGKITHLDIRP